MCGNGDGFVKVTRLKGPDSFNAAWMDMSMSSSECEQACLNNCSCTAFISMNIDGMGTRCLAWYGELMDIVEYSNVVWELNVCVDAKELGSLLWLLAFFLFCILSLLLISVLGSWTHRLFLCFMFFFRFFFIYFLVQLLTLRCPKVFLAITGNRLLQYCLLLCHCFWHPW